MSWRERALCARVQSAHDLFHQPNGGAPEGEEHRVETARSICAGCPVADECFNEGLRVREAWAIRGGVDFSAVNLNMAPLYRQVFVSDFKHVDAEALLADALAVLANLRFNAIWTQFLNETGQPVAMSGARR